MDQSDLKAPTWQLSERARKLTSSAIREILKVTERPEASMMGLSAIVGTSREAIVHEASKLLKDAAAYRAMSQGQNPYGDGRAAERIAEALSRWFEGQRPPLQQWEEFQGPVRLDQVAA